MSRENEYQEATKIIDDLGRAFEEFKEANDRTLEKKASGEAFSDLEIKVQRIDKVLEEKEAKIKQLESRWEAEKSAREALEETLATGGTVGNKKVLEEHRNAFWAAWADGFQGEARAELQKAQRKYISHLPQEKQVNLGSAPAGEAFVPELISSQLEQYELNLSPIRRLIPVVTVNTTDFKQIVDLRGTASGWLAETGSRAVTDSPTLRVRTPTWGELYARPQATEWAAMDIAGMEAWLARSVAEEFVKAEGQAVISGNGTNKPTGLFNQATAATADDTSPGRNASAFEHIVTPASPDDITEHMLALIYKLKSQYRLGAKFAFNSATAGLIRRAKASDGHYLWQPSLVQGQPNMVAGYEFEILEDLDDVGLSPLGDPIVFGNWPRAYLLAQRSDVRVLFDPYTTIGLQSWWFRRREGGIPLNNEALKIAAR